MFALPGSIETSNQYADDNDGDGSGDRCLDLAVEPHIA